MKFLQWNEAQGLEDCGSDGHVATMGFSSPVLAVTTHIILKGWEFDKEYEDGNSCSNDMLK